MRYLLIAFLTFSACTFSMAQKFGHLNSMEVLKRLPGIVQADSVLVIFQQNIQKEGEALVNDFRVKYEAYVKDAQSGTLSKLQAQTRETQLQQDQDAIKAFENAAQMRIVQRRQELYEPILNQVDEAIKALGDAEGYTMIFDSSQQSIVFLTKSMDVSEMILARIAK
ncbi:MAG: OmpH family outer membrane protein [Saprospiraceae bacterium]|nr:OmpH family outer membrane protein [Saprospiraceae bacterium]